MALLEQWALIEADLQDAGIDVDDDALMAARTWRWLRTRIFGLAADPSTRLARALNPPKRR